MCAGLAVRGHTSADPMLRHKQLKLSSRRLASGCETSSLHPCFWLSLLSFFTLCTFFIVLSILQFLISHLPPLACLFLVIVHATLRIFRSLCFLPHALLFLSSLQSPRSLPAQRICSLLPLICLLNRFSVAHKPPRSCQRLSHPPISSSGFLDCFIRFC